ncbi:MAG: hypothetical protein GY868_15040 [Deltaproteobacteria bacterium]|nr:hypothetical protein [Deltaproteobacteria bacterium]
MDNKSTTISKLLLLGFGSSIAEMPAGGSPELIKSRQVDIYYIVRR